MKRQLLPQDIGWVRDSESQSTEEYSAVAFRLANRTVWLSQKVEVNRSRAQDRPNWLEQPSPCGLGVDVRVFPVSFYFGTSVSSRRMNCYGAIENGRIVSEIDIAR